MDHERALSGIRVLAVDQYMAGPYCTMLLADAGAEVIKIERPGTGDPRRAMPPFVERDGVRKAAGFMGYNRNKRSLALDIHAAEGRAILRRLAADADVMVDNLRPGSLEGLGLGWEEMRAVNPRLVYAIISGFGRAPGRRGPFSDRPAFDIVAEAMSGVMHLVGFADRPPSWTIYGLADVYSGMVTAFGITQALLMRERTGEGQLVDSALYDNMLSLNESMITLHSCAGQSPRRGEPRNAYPRAAYRAADGWIALNVPDEIVWKRLAAVVGRPGLADDPRTRDAAARIENREFVDGQIERWLAARTRVEACEALNAAGVPTGPVQTAEDVFACPQVAARGLLTAIDDPEVGEHLFCRTPPLLSAALDQPTRPSPGLGEHTREILADLVGLDDAGIDDLARRGIVGMPSDRD